MVRKYKYITFSDRKQIAAWYRAGERPADIADRLGVSTKTVYLELKRGETVGEDGAPVLDRNQRRAYNPVIAQQTVQASFGRRGRTPADSRKGGVHSDAV